EADLIWMALPGIANVVRESLLEAVLSGAHKMEASTLLCYLAESDTANLSFMDSEACNAEIVAGYSRWTMNIGPVPEANVPQGTIVYASDNPDELLAATRVSWDDLPGHRPATQAAVRQAIEAFGAANHFVLTARTGEPVGL